MNMINYGSHFDCADAALFLLGQELDEASAAMNTALKACERLDRKCGTLFPPELPKWEEPSMPEDVRTAFHAMSVEDMVHSNRSSHL